MCHIIHNFINSFFLDLIIKIEQIMTNRKTQHSYIEDDIARC